MVIEEGSDRFTMEWVRYYVLQHGSENVSITMNENGRMAIVVNEN